MVQKSEFRTVEFFRKVRDEQAAMLAGKSHEEIIAFAVNVIGFGGVQRQHRTGPGRQHQQHGTEPEQHRHRRPEPEGRQGPHAQDHDGWRPAWNAAGAMKRCAVRHFTSSSRAFLGTAEHQRLRTGRRSSTGRRL